MIVFFVILTKKNIYCKSKIASKTDPQITREFGLTDKLEEDEVVLANKRFS